MRQAQRWDAAAPLLLSQAAMTGSKTPFMELVKQRHQPPAQRPSWHRHWNP